ncbi:Short Transient Receptor Potential Channel 4 [Manis pentadactyla]|nr:Short Transient Receptor Potential Channel 4 [Manis pentadactyla]
MQGSAVLPKPEHLCSPVTANPASKSRVCQPVLLKEAFLQIANLSSSLDAIQMKMSLIIQENCVFHAT